ncbi:MULTISPECIES: hypothetical protein [unclassified Microbacterium]|uniref:hypothetical protein n=1 Tax=unclassified Microbacterium TaxID=2609290 RepID=UPI00214AB624|nr:MULTISPECIES: hypothetical protein [unclassified Microbacterium]MCR2810306.1 hypothetical protein [Microbacterium sp. zg.B185]WIM18368.1 hypothetical protein QNO12_12260 [Microbacterium sp. zg-B185]
MTRLTVAEAPTVHPRLLDVANGIAATGGIAIVGRPAPWGERSPTHLERFTPHAFLNRLPPLLLAEHTGPARAADLIADGIASESSRHGFDAVWSLHDTFTAVDHLFGYLADGISGLSVETRVSGSRFTSSLATGPVREVDTATMFAVAVVDDPSYPSARILHVVTPDALWSYSPEAGRLGTTDNAVGAALDARMRARNADRARETAAFSDRIADALAGRTDAASAIRSDRRPNHDHAPVETVATALGGFTLR